LNVKTKKERKTETLKGSAGVFLVLRQSDEGFFNLTVRNDRREDFPDC
jgi:hypothetical protein